MELKLDILPSNKIDSIRWDQCVQNDISAKCYNLYAVVDTLSDKWLGLIVNDYQAVVALPIKSIGYKVLYTPAFIQHFDIVGNLNQVERQSVFNFIVSSFIFGTYKVQYDNLGVATKRRNYILPLNSSYEDIKKRYSKVAVKNLKKAAPNWTIQRTEHIVQLIAFYKSAYGDKAAYKNKHYEALRQLFQKLLAKKQLHIYELYVEGELAYVGGLIDDGKRLYYMLGAPNELGRKARATYIFLDYIFQQYAASNYIFDFEGSEIDNVATFYRSFGPDEEYYYHYQWNRIKPSIINKILNKVL